MNKLWIVVVVLGLALAGCPFNREARADPVQAGLDQEFVLHGGQQAVINGENLTLRFTEVPEDSRCPKSVSCFWTGLALVVVLAQIGDNDPAKVEFNTNPAPGQTRMSIPVGAYVVDLKSLDPYPETPDQSIPLSDYRATLIVRRG